MGGQRQAPSALPLGQRHGTCCTGGWMGPRSGLDEGGKSLAPTGIRFPDPPARGIVSMQIMLSGCQFKNSRTDLNKTRHTRKKNCLNVFLFQKAHPAVTRRFQRRCHLCTNSYAVLKKFFFSCCGVFSFSCVSYPDSDRPHMKQTFNFRERKKSAGER